MLLGSLALGAITPAFFCRKTVTDRRSRCLHIIGLSLIVVALFPYISATDDVLRIEHFRSHYGPVPENAINYASTSSDDGAAIGDLLRLYETIDSPLICRAFGMLLAAVFSALAVLSLVRFFERLAPSCAGRSPPSF